MNKCLAFYIFRNFVYQIYEKECIVCTRFQKEMFISMFGRSFWSCALSVDFRDNGRFVYSSIVQNASSVLIYHNEMVKIVKPSNRFESTSWRTVQVQ